MPPTRKRRAVVSYENMSPELAAAFAEKYPRGNVDYFPDLTEYPKPDGTKFYAVTVEIPDAVYLVKIKVKTDDIEDLNRWLDNVAEGQDVETATKDSNNDANSSLPDGDPAMYSSEGGEDEG